MAQSIPEFKNEPKQETSKLGLLFTSDYKSDTLKLWGALFLSFTTLYFLMNTNDGYIKNGFNKIQKNAFTKSYNISII